MGRNFHRIIRIQSAFSFSVSSAEEVYDWLSDQGFLDPLNHQGNGIIDVPVSSLEKMLGEIEVSDPKVLKEIRENIKEAKNAKIEVISYEVF